MSSQLVTKSLTGFSWMLSSSVAQFALRGITIVVLARLLTPSDFGLFATANIIVGLCQMLARMGIGDALVQRPDVEPGHLSSAQLLLACTALAGVAAVFLASPLLAVFFDMPQLTGILRAMCLSMIVVAASMVPQAMLVRQLNFRLVAVFQVASFVLGYACVGVTLSFLGFGVWALVAAHLAQYTVEAILLLGFCRIPFRARPRFVEAGNLASYGSVLTMAKIANYVAVQGDSLIVGKLLGTTAVGLYSRAHSLIDLLPKMGGQAIDKVLFAAMATVQEQRQQLALGFRRVLALALFVFPSVSVCLFVMAPEIILVVLGDQWTGCIPAFRILSVAVFFRFGYKIGAVVARSTGRTWLLFLSQALFAVLVLAGAWLGAKRGIEGVAVAVTAAVIIQYIFMFCAAVRMLGTVPGRLLALHLRAVSTALVVTACVLLARAGIFTVIGSPLARLATTAAAIGIPAALLPYTFPAILGEDGRWWLDKLLNWSRGQ